MADFKTTFIPQKPIIPDQRMAHRHTIDPFTFAAWVFFALAILGTGAIYGYKLLLIENIESRQTEIKEIKESINPTLVKDLKRTDALLKTAEQLLNNHITLAPFFKYLEEKTLQGVRFTSLDYQMLPSGILSLRLGGEALDYAAVALQSDIFGKDRKIIDPIFSDFSLTQRGTVQFTINTQLDKDFLLYRNMIEQADSSPEVPSGSVSPKGVTVPKLNI